MKRIAKWAALASAGIALGLASATVYELFLQNEQLSPQPTAEEPEQPLLCLYKGTVDRGEALFDELVASGISARETERLVRALSDVMDMRRLRPGESYELFTDENGRVARFSYVRGVRERITAVQEGGELKCFVEKVPLRERLRKLEGVVRSSLWESMVGQGLDPELVLKLADIFAWEIDFLTETRDGDRYELVVREYCLGDSVIEYGQVLAARYSGRERSLTAIRFETADGGGGYYSPSGRSLRRTFLRSPLNYRRISSHFTRRRFHPILKKYRPHLGVDYAAAAGTPIVSIGDGVVVKAGWNGGFGRYVEIRHNSVYKSCYGHLSRIARGIRKGARVRQNQVIGYVGSTGLATGPHLDFRVKKNGSYVNPLKLKSPRAEPVPQRELARFKVEAEWALWALEYLPGGYAADEDALRNSLLAEAPVLPTGSGRGP